MRRLWWRSLSILTHHSLLIRHQLHRLSLLHPTRPLSTPIRRLMAQPAADPPSTSTLTSSSHPSHPRNPSSTARRPPQRSSQDPPAPPPPYDFSTFHLTDIGANLLDDQYSGIYRGTPKHSPDIPAVLSRAYAFGVRRILVTAGTLEESKAAITFIQQHSFTSTSSVPILHTTCGIHPTRTKAFASLSASDLTVLTESLRHHVQSHPSVVAIGECGLDADRTHFSSMSEQLSIFPLHLHLASVTSLPLFLHDRGVDSALVDLIKASPHPLPSPPGVVHSFTSSLHVMQAYLDLGFFIGLNGCSLREPQGLDVARTVPLDRMLVETDAPWCEVKATHAGWGHVKSHWEERRVDRLVEGVDGVLVKGRNEPCKLLQVVEIIAGLRGMTVEDLCRQLTINTARVFNRGGFP